MKIYDVNVTKTNFKIGAYKKKDIISIETTTLLSCGDYKQAYNKAKEIFYRLKKNDEYVDYVKIEKNKYTFYPKSAKNYHHIEIVINELEFNH